MNSLNTHAALPTQSLTSTYRRGFMKLLNSSTRVRVVAALLILSLAAIGYSTVVMRRASASASPAARPMVIGTCESLPGGVIEVEGTGGSGAQPTGYATLGLAFAAINTGVHTGAIAIDVCGDTNEAAATALLNASGTGASSYTAITISPAGGAARTITGATTAGSPMIDFSGADNVTIDGLNTGGNSLTISNTTVSATTVTSTIRFIGGATNNTITNSSILGSSSSSVATNGGNIFFSTDAVTTAGNDNNTISNNNIGPAGANLPTKGILCNGSIGTTAIGNSGLVINNNNIFDYFGAAVTSAGVAVNGGCNTFSITNNRLYQTATRTWTTGALHTPILMNSSTATSGVQGMTITGNIIGYASNTQTGTYTLTGLAGTFNGIRFVGITAGTVSNINNNTVANVSLTGVTSSGTSSGAPFMGIFVSNGLTNANGNTIGSQAATGSFNFSTTSASAADVIAMFNFGVDNWTTNNNLIGGITAANLGAGAANAYGLRINTGAAVSWTATGNTIGGTVANSIQSTSTATGTVVNGMLNSNPIGTITGNTIRNLTTAGGTGTGSTASIGGIVVTTSSLQTISQNTLNTFSATGASTVNGITTTGTGSNTISRNKIYDLQSNNAGGLVNGMQLTASGTTVTIANNLIGDLRAPASTVTSPASAIIGLNITSTSTVSAINASFNTIYINATSAGANFATTGVFHTASTTATTAALTLRNNIIVNTSTANGTGLTVAFRRSSGAAGTLANYGSASNNNDFYAGTPSATNLIYSDGTSTAQTITAYKNGVFTAGTIAPRDSASISENPPFLSTTGSSAQFLHINPATPTQLESGGIPVAGITDDFDGDTRNASTPDIGADEFSGILLDLVAPAITYAPLGNTSLTTNRVLSVTITDTTGVAGGANSPRIYFKRSTDASYVSTQCLMTGGTAQNGTYNCTIDYSLLTPPTAATGDIIQYFVVAQDTAGTPNVGANPGAGFSATSVNSVTTPPTTPNSYTIVTAFPAAVTVGTGGTYTSLTNVGGLFEAMNAGVFTGNTTVTITSDLTGETGTVALNQLVEDGAGNYTVTIKPSGAPRAVSGSSAAYMIAFNGTDNVIFDGSLSGGTDRSLTVTNTGTGGVIAFTSGAAGAKGNTLKNVNVVGGGPTTTLIGIAFGGNAFGSAGTDNDNNRIENNSVRRTIIGIYSAGASVANQNTGTVVTRNDVSGTGVDRVSRTGMVFFNDNGIQITENLVGGINSAESIDAIGIGVGVGVADAQFSNTAATSGGITNALVSRNQVNGVAHTNTWGAAGIAIAGDVAGANTISNNMVTGVIANTTSPDIVAGIFVAGVTGSTTRLYHNSVANTGDRGATAAQQASFAVAISGTNPIVELKNNIFYNTQVATGGGAAAESYSIGMTTATFTNLDSNYNDFYVAGANASFFRSGSLAGAAGTDYATLAAWQTAVSDDANSQEVDPLFVNPTNDLHLQGTSPVLGDGILIAGVNNDFDNDLRDDAPDIGADEIVSGRTGTIPAGTYRDANLGAGSTLGGNVTIQGTLTLSGVVTTGANTLTIDCAGTVSGASDANYVDGNVQKNFCAPGTFSYPVGDPATGSLAPPPLNGFMPVNVTVTALGVNPSNLTVNANNGLAPSTPPLNPATTLSAFWTLTETGDLTANLTFNYQQGDVVGNENNYRVITIEGGTPYNFPSTVLNTVDNQASVSGITNFSDWTVGEAFAPTSSPANVSGRVLSHSGFPLSGVTLTLLDTILVENRTTVTDANGAYSFNAILTGRDIVVTPARHGYNFSPQTRTFPHTGNVSNIDFTAAPDTTVPRPTANDFDGDGKADLSVFRPADATWYIYQSLTNSVRSEPWGLLGDRIVPADYDGDAKTDVAVFRPSNATWYIHESTTGEMRVTQWGLADDVLTPADYDGDGKADVAVFRPSSGTWYIRESLSGNIRTVNWGMAGDRPVAADYDGDGRADLAVFRPSSGTWYVVKSSDGSNLTENWGLATDRPVVGDYDGDSRSDLAVFRPDTNTWYVKFSSNGTVTAKVHGTSVDVLTAGDYDGDGKTDHAVWENTTGNWNILRSVTGVASGQQWGINGDIPAPSAYIP